MSDEISRFPEAFLRQATATPANIAVEFCGRRVSYGELAAWSGRLAVELRERGVGPGVLVGVCLDRSVELVVAILGVLRAGGAWVPLDPAYPADRLAYMLADSGAGLLLTNDEAAPNLPANDLPRLDPARYRTGDQVAPVVLGADDLAYMIYTSGSTGRPKGVLLSHRGLSNLAAAQVSAFGVAVGDRVLQFAPASFDASVFEMAMALHAGATLIIAPRPAIAPGVDLWNTLRDNRISHVTLPPSVLATLPGDHLPDLRVLICAGESLPEGLVRQWSKGRRMFNAYGPTETTVWATLAEIDPAGGTPTIGVAIDGMHVSVVDERLRPVPVGEPGELVIGGKGVARGYHGRPSLTAQKFVPTPISRTGGFIALVTECTSGRMDSSSSWAASTIRSSCAVCGSNPTRSPRYYGSTPPLLTRQ